MFGDYAIYLDEKVVALVCDNRLFLKPTQNGRALLSDAGEINEVPPYRSAKPALMIADLIEYRELMAQLLHATAIELPTPKRKKVKTTRK